MALPPSLPLFSRRSRRSWRNGPLMTPRPRWSSVTLEIRSEIADLPTVREMWEYLERRYCGSSQAQLYTLYQALSGLQQGEDTIAQFYSRFCGLWH